MTLLRMTLIIEYDADPEYYEGATPLHMAERDQKTYTDNPQLAAEMVDIYGLTSVGVQVVQR